MMMSFVEPNRLCEGVEDTVVADNRAHRAPGSSSESSRECADHNTVVDTLLDLIQHSPGFIYDASTTPLTSIWEVFEKRGTIGSGTYGKVYKVCLKKQPPITTSPQQPQQSEQRLSDNDNNNDAHNPSPSSFESAVDDTKFYALKQCEIVQAFCDQGVPSTMLREYSHLSILRDCPYIVPLIGTILQAKYVFFVFELSKYDLHTYLQEISDIRSLPPASRSAHQQTSLHGFRDATLFRRLLWQLATALDFSHANSIVHRDIKSHNILVDIAHARLLLADFGLSRRFHLPMKDYSPTICTLWYRPPEVLLGESDYTTAVDVWSLGCVFAEILLLRPLFTGDSEIDQLYQIFRFMGTPTEETWSGVSCLPDFSAHFPVWNGPERSFQKSFRRLLVACNYYNDDDHDHTPHGFLGSANLDAFVALLDRMLHLDPRRRASMREVLSDPFFAGYCGGHETAASSSSSSSAPITTNDTDAMDVVQDDDAMNAMDVGKDDAMDVDAPPDCSQPLLCCCAKEPPSQQHSQILRDPNYFGDTKIHLEVQPFVADILGRQLASEIPLMSGAYMVHYKDINPKMRNILVDWLVDVACKFHLHTSTFFRGIQLLDRYLDCDAQKYTAPAAANNAVVSSTKQTSSSLSSAHHLTVREELQLVGMTCLWMACKVDENWPPELNDFVYISAQSSTEDQLRSMERHILAQVDAGDLHRPLLTDFLSHLYYLPLQATNIHERTTTPADEPSLVSRNNNRFAALDVESTTSTSSNASSTRTVALVSNWTMRQLAAYFCRLVLLDYEGFARNLAKPSELVAAIVYYAHHVVQQLQAHESTSAPKARKNQHHEKAPTLSKNALHGATPGSVDVSVVTRETLLEALSHRIHASCDRLKQLIVSVEQSMRYYGDEDFNSAHCAMRRHYSLRKNGEVAQLYDRYRHLTPRPQFYTPQEEDT